MQLSLLLSPDAVFARLEATSKKQALRLLSVHASESTGCAEKEIFQVLMEREQHGSTGMGGGVSIPHGRLERLGNAHALIATLAKPVEFGAVDERPVDIICLLLTPAGNNTLHMKALALMSKLLRDKALCAELRSLTDTAAMYRLLEGYGNDR